MSPLLDPQVLSPVALIVAMLALVLAIVAMRRANLASAARSLDGASTEAALVLSLFEHLAHASPRVQLATAAMLIERLRGTVASNPQRRMIAHALIAILKERAVDEASTARTLQKFIADNIVVALGARGNAYAAAITSPLAEFDLQCLRLDGVFWADLDARGVDFYGSSLIGCSLRNARLTHAILYNADLSKAVLHGADLTGANLTHVKLAGARYNSATRWPAGFDPSAGGAILQG